MTPPFPSPPIGEPSRRIRSATLTSPTGARTTAARDGTGADTVDGGHAAHGFPWQRFTSIGAGAPEVQKNSGPHPEISGGGAFISVGRNSSSGAVGKVVNLDDRAAIGSPFGERQSLSVGVISALDRAIPSLTDFDIVTPADFVGFENYARLLSDDTFWLALTHSAIYLLVTPILLCIAWESATRRRVHVVWWIGLGP